jgi:hypothetical protein
MDAARGNRSGEGPDAVAAGLFIRCECELDWALLLHLAATERFYQLHTFDG